MLEPNTCFDAEMYADELEDADKMDFREDQRSKYHRYVKMAYSVADTQK